MSLLGLLLAASNYPPEDVAKQPIAAGAALDVNDLFKTTLYIGDITARTIEIGVNLFATGGLIILYGRGATCPVMFFDSVNGWNYSLVTNSRAGKVNNTTTLITNVASSSIDITSSVVVNKNTGGYALHAFKIAERFLDVVTYTGNGDTSRTLAHNLTIKPGLIIIKKTSNLAGNTTDNWFVWNAYSGISYINDYSDRVFAETGAFFTTTPSDASNFFVGSTLNTSGSDYTAYIFADDRTDTGVIRVGAVFNRPTPGRGNHYLGWESQFLMEKHLDLFTATTTSKWGIKDTSRGMGKLGIRKNIKDNLIEAEQIDGALIAYGKGLEADTNTNSYAGSLYQYLAIRKPELITPTAGTDVLYTESVSQRDLQITSACPFESDLAYVHTRAATPTASYANMLMLKNNSMGCSGSPAASFYTNTTASLAVTYPFLTNDGKNVSIGSGWNDPTYGAFLYYLMRRAKGFLDIVSYVGTFKAATKIKHGLGATPTMIIVKSKNIVGNYIICVPELGSGFYLQLASTAAKVTSLLSWSNILPTDTEFTIGNLASVNTLNEEYSALVFGSLSGISKIGTYIGNGTNQDIDCGFTTGARFVLIKAHNSTGNWTIHDTVRGIVTGNDVYHNLNATTAEVKTRDNINPLAAGFNVVHNTTSNLNVSTSQYIYLAIA